MKILILKPSSLGDVVQALPVLRLLKRHFPTSEIHWWLDSNFIPLLQNDPDLHTIIPFERKKWSSGSILRTIYGMRQQKFDWVIDLQSLARSGTFAWLANGGLTVGLDDPREGARGYYDIAVRRPSFHTHAVDWYLETLRALHVPIHESFDWLPENSETKALVQRKWPEINLSRWFILNPGARWDNKRWPASYYAQLVRLLANDFPEHRFAILGGESDAPLGLEIAAAAPERCLNLTGKTSLPEMVEWIRASDLMVTNDTGPMHIGAALGKQVIGIFGPTEPKRTGPYRQIENALSIPLPCAPCLKSTCHYFKPMECLHAISPQQVRAEMFSRLGK